MTEPTYPNHQFERSPQLFGSNPPASDSWQRQTGVDPHHARPAILLALTQVLSPVGIKFKFWIDPDPDLRTDETLVQSEQTLIQSPDLWSEPLADRLWVQCHVHDSWDARIVAEPLARALRRLELRSFQAAIVEFGQAATADWRLTIDLAPPIVLLQHWARWGDVQTIAKLVNIALAPSGIRANTVLTNFSLQIDCLPIDPAAAPDRDLVLKTIAPLLIALSPQGIRSTTIRGIERVGSSESSVWTTNLRLPAFTDHRFEPPALMMAASGDRAALKFILERLLNPDLERCLAVGIVSISFRYHHQLLHIMSEAVICPSHSQVATTVIATLRQLAIPTINGVRVYGRGSGQLLPLWADGAQLIEHKQFLLAPAAPVTPERAKIDWTQKLREYLIGTGIWKPQLVMQSADRLVYHRRFRWQPPLLWLVCGLGLTVVGDLTLRTVLEKQSVAPTLETAERLSFNNPLLEQQLAQFQRRCIKNGVPDVLIVGSSRALRGVDPVELQRSLHKRGYRTPKIYNFSINGATAQIIDLILRQLLTPQQLPKLVIWADGARAFNSGRTDRTYDTIVASDRYQHMVLMSGVEERRSSLFQVQSSVKNTYQAIDSRIDREFARVSPAYSHRDLLKTWLQSQVNDVSQALDLNQGAIANSTVASDEPKLDLNGFMAFDVRFDPKTYYDRYARVRGDSDGDYVNFQLSGSQSRALQQVTNLLAEHQIPLIFVNTPLSDIYLDRFRRQHERTFRKYMQQLMTDRQLTFIDLDNLFSKQYQLFSDPSHLNQFGAIAVSRTLAQSPLISWQKLSDRLAK